MLNFESLLYSSYQHLNLISIFIEKSGAIIDLAVDIKSSVSEVVKKSDIIKYDSSGMVV